MERSTGSEYLDSSRRDAVTPEVLYSTRVLGPPEPRGGRTLGSLGGGPVPQPQSTSGWREGGVTETPGFRGRGGTDPVWKRYHSFDHRVWEGCRTTSFLTLSVSGGSLNPHRVSRRVVFLRSPPLLFGRTPDESDLRAFLLPRDGSTPVSFRPLWSCPHLGPDASTVS